MSQNKMPTLEQVTDEITLVSKVYDALCEVGIDSVPTRRAVNYALAMYLEGPGRHIDADEQTPG